MDERAAIETVRRAYAALNRGDAGGFVADFDPQILRVEFEGLPSAGTYRGIDAVRSHVERGRSSWAEGSCEPERFAVAGDRVVVSVQVRVRLAHESHWREGRIGDVFAFRDGRVIEFRTFGDETEAMLWVGALGWDEPSGA